VTQFTIISCTVELLRLVTSNDIMTIKIGVITLLCMESIWPVSKLSTESVVRHRELVFVYTPPTPTRRNSTVESRRRRRRARIRYVGMRCRRCSVCVTTDVSVLSASRQVTSLCQYRFTTSVRHIRQTRNTQIRRTDRSCRDITLHVRTISDKTHHETKPPVENPLHYISVI